MMRRALMTIGGFAVLAGCLFPSFDDLKNNGAAPTDDDDDTVTDAGKKPKDSGASGTSSGSTSGTSGTSGVIGTSSGTTGSLPDAAADTGTTTPTKVVVCGGAPCKEGEACCGDTGGAQKCVPPGNSSGCVDFLRCDGVQDCPAGQKCCQDTPGAGSTSCKNGCGFAYTMCQPEQPMCPGNVECIGEDIGFNVTSPHTCKGI